MPLTPEQIIEYLRSEGHRITIPRRWTLKVLHEEGRHLTVEQIYQRLNEEGIPVDEATIYRTLQWLKESGFVAQTDLGLGADVYSLLGDAPHHHLVCLNCGKIIDVEHGLFTSLAETLIEKYHFSPRIDHFAIFGFCEDCQSDGQYAKHTGIKAAEVGEKTE